MSYHAQAFAAAIRAAVAGATLSFTPTLVMVGTLAHYPENSDLTADVPAVFCEAVSWEAEPLDVGATAIRWVGDFRVLVVDSWTESDDLHAERCARAQAIWDLFMGSSTGQLDLAGQVVAGPYTWTAYPYRARHQDLPEEIALTSNGVEKLFCVDVFIRIEGETVR